MSVEGSAGGVWSPPALADRQRIRWREWLPFQGAYVPLEALTLALVLFVGVDTLLRLGFILGIEVMRIYGTDLSWRVVVLVLLTILGTGLTSLAIRLSSVPVWILWHWRAAANLAALGRATPIRPDGHVLWWFVPITNLWMPLRAM